MEPDSSGFHLNQPGVSTLGGLGGILRSGAAQVQGSPAPACRLQVARPPPVETLSCTHKLWVGKGRSEADTLRQCFKLQPASPQGFPTWLTVAAATQEAAKLSNAAPERAQRHIFR